MEGEPLDRARARELIRTILDEGEYRITQHAREEMQADALDEDDVLNVLRGGWVEYEEERGRTWRYRVTTHQICVVVAFRSEEILVVVTAWRKKR